MANRTSIGATAVHGTDPQNLIPLITRTKIYNSIYWKEHCFGLTAESIVNKAVTLKYIGGLYGGLSKPTHFLCLTLKLLQLQPERDIMIWFLKQKDFKYLTALAAFYIRLTFRAIDTFAILEPMLADYRKLSTRTLSGWSTMCMDEFIESLLTQELVLDTTLPYLTRRFQLEDTKLKGGYLPRQVSPLDAELNALQQEQKHNNSSSRSSCDHVSTTSGFANISDVSPDRLSRKRSRAEYTTTENCTDKETIDSALDMEAETIAAPEGSAEYWNQMRAKLGMSALRK
jgi:pre-mRNA-splicing factor 38A